MKKFFMLALAILLIFSNAIIAEAEDVNPLIKRGDYGPEVIELHQKLIELGLYSLRAESPWGPDSVEAIKVLQSVLGIDQTGVVSAMNEFDMYLSLNVSEEFLSQLSDAEKSYRITGAVSKIKENLFVDVEYSEDALDTQNGGFIFTTTVEGNSFSSVQWQLFDADRQYIENIDANGKGLHEGDYVFPYETGEYLIRFKANGNSKDSYVRTMVTLQNGTTYHYVYYVESLESKRVVTTNVAFGEKKN